MFKIIRFNEFVGLDKNLCVRIHNEYDYNLLMNQLELHGYEWISGKKPTELLYFKLYEIIWISDKVLYRSSLENYYYYYYKKNAFPLIEVNEFLSLFFKKSKKILRRDIDPYNEENWGYTQENKIYESEIDEKFKLRDLVLENKIDELFETEEVYNYRFIKKRKMIPFIDYIYTFITKDNIEYYVTLSHDLDINSMSVKFTDKDHYVGIKNKIKDKYVNMDKFDAINVLNTIIKICKDFYDKNSDTIKSFTTATLDEKRLRIYKYILKKYFKGWEIDSYFDPRGGLVINCEPKKIKRIL